MPIPMPAMGRTQAEGGKVHRRGKHRSRDENAGPRQQRTDGERQAWAYKWATHGPVAAGGEGISPPAMGEEVEGGLEG